MAVTVSAAAVGKLSTGQVDPFHYDPERNMVMCIACQRGVSAEWGYIDNHLTTRHPTQYKQVARAELRDRYTQRGYLIQDTDPVAEEHARLLGFHRFLPYEEGYCCPVDQCRVSTTTKGWAAVMRERHPGREPHPVSCYVSWLWGRMRHQFVVQRPRPGSSTEPDAPVADEERVLTDAVARLDADIQQLQVHATISRNPTTREPLWLERTGWPMTFEHQDMRELHELTDLDPQPDEGMSVPAVRAAVRQLLGACAERLDETYNHGGDGVLLRRILYAVEDHGLRRPLERLRVALPTYSLLWEKLTLYLVRTALAYRDRGGAGRCFRVATFSNLLWVADASLGGDDPSPYGLQHHLLLVYRDLIEQVGGWGEQTNPILTFLGIQGFNLATLRWESPSRHGTVLSQVIYCIRLVALECVFRDHAADPSEPLTDRLAAYCAEHLHSGRPRVFDEVFSQRNFAQVIAKDFHGRPSIHWEADRGALLYEGRRLEINRVRYWVKTLIEEAELTTCSLLGVTRPYLDEFDPKRLEDNLTHEAHGASLIDLNLRSLGDRRSRVLQRARTDASLPWYRVWAQPVPARDRVRVEYDDLVRTWKQQVAVLLVVAGGGVPRATELGATLWRNTQSSMRSYYVAMGHLLWVADYNKTEKRTGAPRVIARFYPRRIGQLVVAYLAEVQPFAQLLATLAAGESWVSGAIHSPLVWHTDGDAWTAEHLSPALKKTTGEHLKVPYGIRAWRQIQIALQEEVGRRDESDEESDDDNLVLQNGHTREVERAHYALTADMLRGLDHKTMTAFLETSRTWHAFLDLAELPVTSVPRKRPLALDTAPTTADLARQIAALRDDLERRGPGPPLALEDGAAAKRVRRGSPEAPPPAAVGPDPWTQVRGRLSRWYPDFHWRSVAQFEAVDRLVYGPRDHDLVVQLPTGAGKTVVIEVAACLEGGKTVVVVVPYRSVRDALVTGLRQKGIDVDDYRSEGWRAVDVVVVVLETWHVDLSFQRLLDDLVSRGRLARIIYDEAHLAVLESHHDFRPWAAVLRCHPVGVQRVFMSATLPREVRERLVEMAGLNPTRLSMVRQSSNIPGIRWEVRSYDPARLRATLEARIDGSRKVIVYTMSKQEGRALSAETGWPFYSGDLSDEEARRTLAEFQQIGPRVLVATTAVGPGMNFTVDHIISVGGGFDGITLAQQGGRLVRRPGQIGVCTLLLTDRDLERIEATTTTVDPIPGKTMLYDFIRTRDCRRAVMMSYLDDEVHPHCRLEDQPCDLCRTRRERDERRRPALRTPGRAPLSLTQAFRATLGSLASPLESGDDVGGRFDAPTRLGEYARGASSTPSVDRSSTTFPSTATLSNFDPTPDVSPKLTPFVPAGSLPRTVAEIVPVLTPTVTRADRRPSPRSNETPESAQRSQPTSSARAAREILESLVPRPSRDAGPTPATPRPRATTVASGPTPPPPPPPPTKAVAARPFAVRPTVPQQLLATLRDNRQRGITCERCWVHGDPQDERHPFVTCPRWWEEPPEGLEDPPTGQKVAQRVDRIRRLHKRVGYDHCREFVLHQNCFFPVRPNPFHPASGDWKWNSKCSVSDLLWVIVEAALQHRAASQALLARWQFTSDEWTAQDNGDFTTPTALAEALMQKVDGEAGTLVIHKVVWDILEGRGLLVQE